MGSMILTSTNGKGGKPVSECHRRGRRWWKKQQQKHSENEKNWF